MVLCDGNFDVAVVAVKLLFIYFQIPDSTENNYSFISHCPEMKVRR